MLKKFLGLLALILLINFSTAIAAQSVTDKAGLLKDTEIELLNQKINKIEQVHKIKIGVAFVKSVRGDDMITASNDFIDKNFANGKNGGIVLLVAMDKRKYEMATDIRMREIITDNDGIPFLKDKFQSDLSAGNYYSATNNFIEGVDELMAYYELHGRAYGQKDPDAFDPMAAGLAVAIALFIGVMIRSTLIGSMSNIRHAMEAIDYLKKNTVKIIENRDTFLFTNIKRRPRGGGGSSGGGGSHGSSHGGGGGSF